MYQPLPLQPLTPHLDPSLLSLIGSHTTRWTLPSPDSSIMGHLVASKAPCSGFPAPSITSSSHYPPPSLSSSHTGLLPSSHSSKTFLPQGLCTCRDFCQNTLPPDRHIPPRSPPSGLSSNITSSERPSLTPPYEKSNPCHSQSSCPISYFYSTYLHLT